ncbi:MAG: DUF3611 family protein [Microcoleaceae cyanobacterium]
MSNNPAPATNSSNLQGLANAFRRWGWIGFWMQVILGLIPILILSFALLFRNLPNSEAAGNSVLFIVLAAACLLALLFALYWCFRYTRLSKKLARSDKHPAKAEVIRCLWIGLLANVVGMSFAVVVSLGQIGTLLFKMLFLVPTLSVYNPRTFIAPFDVITMQAMINTIAAELIGIMIALWLLRRVYQYKL